MYTWIESIEVFNLSPKVLEELPEISRRLPLWTERLRAALPEEEKEDLKRSLPDAEPFFTWF